MNNEKNMPRLPVTKPISINIRSPDNLSNSYDLKLHTFDPDKSTPPSDWNARLFFRVYGESINDRRKKIAK